MARNKIEDLNNHLFEQLERLNDDDLTPEKMELEVKRAKAMSGVTTSIIQAHKLTLSAIRLMSDENLKPSEMPVTLSLKEN